MRTSSPFRRGAVAVGLVLLIGLAARGDVTPKSDKTASDQTTVAADATPSATSTTVAAAATTSATQPKPKYPPHSEVLKDFTPIDGLIKLYRKDTRLYAELPASQFNKDFIVLISIARGIGEGSLLGGMTWGFGDDWLWQFRKVDDNVHIVRRNVRFRAAKGTPEETAVGFAYTDSVLYSLPIVTIGPAGGSVVDLSQVFMSDLPQIGRALPGFAFAANRSTWAAVKGFKDNVELEVAATYASSGSQQLVTVPDSRGVTINVHYSISALPQTGYKPRLADDRVGYFLTVVKDYSKKGDDDRFVRYINRWDLQKADPSAEISPPKKPIVFWVEKTVPYQYRKAISDGILEWNKAFEKAGFYNAIEVRQQPDNADWDPEDVNYNTFRWITASAGFAMGPSRVNPETGQILDADIIFDADFVQFWKHEYETFTPASIAALTGGPLEADYYERQESLPVAHRHSELCRCELHSGMARELAFASTAALARAAGADSAREIEKLIQQGLKEVTMHEVGHTLGLRHNFKASAFLSLDELNDVERTREVGLTASVMDYNPTNIVPQGTRQGDYFSTTIGPYDYWAIEYGYRQFAAGSPEAESAELKKIASRAAEPGMSFATDEDTRGIDPDPLSNRFDLSSDPIAYAQQRARLVNELWPGLVDRVTKEGDGYQRARQAFGILLSNHGIAVFTAARHVGGLYVNRDHKGDPDGRPPFVVVPAARQREALALVEKEILGDEPFSFPPELYNYLASTRWSHWGLNFPTRADYAVHEVILQWQQRVLDQLLSSVTIKRLHDSELRVPTDEDALTTAELLDRLTKAIFSELDQLKPGQYTERKPAVSSLRRNLQREYVKRLANVVLGSGDYPADCQSVAAHQLRQISARLSAPPPKVKLDTYTAAHLEDLDQRIRKVLDAQLTISRP